MRKKEENLNTASGLRIAMILLGIAVTPVLLSSSSLGNQLSSSSLISVVLLGGVILTLLSAITISVGEKARLPTYGIVKYSFGEKGAIAINILMAISLFGWIAVTANMFGHSVHDLLAQHGLEVPLALLVAAGWEKLPRLPCRLSRWCCVTSSMWQPIPKWQYQRRLWR